MRKILSNVYFIHAIVLLGFLALWGVISTKNLYLLFPMTLSFLGAVCGGFVRVIDAIKENAK